MLESDLLYQKRLEKAIARDLVLGYHGSMMEINLPHLSRLLSEKLGERIEITGCEKIGSGYHSDGFKLSAANGTCYFLKRVKSRDLGFELPERQVLSLMMSHGMVQRSGFAPKSLGVIVDDKHDSVMLPDVDEETVIYHVQEFQPMGKSCWSLLQERRQKRKVDEADIAELERVTDVLCRLHKIKYPSQDSQQLKNVYNDQLRNLLTNPELTVMLLHDFPQDHPLLPPQEQGRYVGLMLQLIHAWKDRSDRLSALHGDFWGANVFFHPDGTVGVIDYSRIPWGDPGVDVAWWLAQYLWLFHETRNLYFQELGERFLEMYAKKAADNEIRRAVSLAMGVMGVIYISPRLHPELDFKVGRRFLDNVVEILQNQQFM